MQIADAWLVLADGKNNIPLRDITPAEAVYLDVTRRVHKDDAEKKIIHISNIREIKRSSSQEKERLIAKYPKENPGTRRTLVDENFPGQSPSFPETFEGAGYEVTNDSPKQGKSLPYPAIDKLLKKEGDTYVGRDEDEGYSAKLPETPEQAALADA